MSALLSQVDALLRPDGDARRPPADRYPPGRAVLLGFCLSAYYGAVMGFYGLDAGHWVQPVYSAIKLPMLLGVSFLISLPSFYVLNVLFGLGSDFGRVMRALAVTQAVLAIVLASFSPMTVFWYVSINDHDWAILFNAILFFLASLCGQWVLRRAYRPLIAENHKHRWMLRAWLGIYAFVGIQMGWVLRPFIGTPTLPATFLRRESWSNAYVEVWGVVWKALHL